ncbi:Hypothetical protein MAG5680 [Mycoplasmopsis agalactiae PG2]|uniref:Type I restriction modification DNA specificity domain-containing protein n=1 Tax=Mycoplasmopsis agalactiae (strain NCTC 10123 / CIP 59.7 / PG2) TaxID=347257 RepID=A5IZ09_MYCAP|nr:restriction endonuclease subunit S [Mycoplasmopsis agalactiae]CAL59268.1 Hypothetical protein MAG5680 [Mycoplasmopsis agalactiae PG2]
MISIFKPKIKKNTNAWEQEKFANIYQFASEGGTPSTSIKKYYENGTIPFIKVEDTVNKYIENGKYFITENGLINSSAWLAPENSIIFTNGATIGNVAINKIKTATKQGILGIIPKQKYDVEFIYYLLSSKNFQNEVNRKITIGTFAMITLSNLDKIKVNLPNYDIERAKISSLFSHLDSLITLHQRKLSSLKNLKNRLLDKMFCDEKSQFPSIRFKEFTNAWEQWKIGDMFSVGRGYVVPKKNIYSNRQGEYIYPIYSSQTVNDGLLGYYNKYLTTNSITWTTDGANAGTVFYRKGLFYATNVCGILSQKQFEPNIYLALALSRVSHKHVTKVGNPKLMNNAMANIDLQITSDIKEQSKISSLFYHLDSLITLHQRG